VRLVAVLAVLALSAGLAGCTQGDPNGGFKQSCPAWIKGPDAQVVNGNLVLTNQTTQPQFDRWDYREPSAKSPGTGFGDGLLQRFNHSLDFLSMDFHFHQGEGKDARLLYVQDAELHVSFFASENGAPGESLDASLEGQPSTAKHEWTFRTTPGGYLIENLTWRVELAHPDQPPNPRGVFVHWEMIPNLDNNIDTASVILMRYSPEFWYRTCSSDGTKV
jgi:hypothetical protein